MKSRNPKIEFDELQMYFGFDYEIDIEGVKGKIVIKQPSLLDIVKFGEKRFYATLNIFITNTTSHRMMLWDMGIDWNTISDFELFCMLYKQIDSEASALIFPDIDFQKFQMCQKKVEDKEELVLYDEEDELEINEEVYFHFSQYLREMFTSDPEEKITSDAVLKKQYITHDKRQAEIDAEKAKHEDKPQSSIRSLISSCINHPGFKYNLKELENIGVCQFYDSVKRLQVYESTTALMRGLYSGMMDSSKIKPEDYNFMKNIN